MSKTFHLTVMSAERKYFDGDAEEIVFSTPVGRMGVLPGHMPLIAAVKEDVMNVTCEGTMRVAAVSQGFAEIGGQDVELFVDSFEWADEIDANRARAALESAQVRIKAANDKVRYTRDVAAINRAMARLKAINSLQDRD
ncbi:MAG: ATP synthase F1 subunit epsilon [Oscillospiraceae bacterium]|jgi:F-type H+-transporting ATPase subunit epsilon|nr:ATP synthase F1 subunit epsilon [Oscillospiraceae bacterium]